MQTSLTRRRFLRTISLSAAALAVPAIAFPPAERGPSGPLPADRGRFPQSVASGDPRPDRLLLWTRVSSAAPRETLLLQLATSDDFSQMLFERDVACMASHDHCVRVRVIDLPPRTTLHYRFLLREDERWVASPAGRTCTAPAPGDDAPLRFAFMSCQDYGGRWYNTLLPLLDEDLDFVLHLGDFVYETVGDPGFQSTDGGRRIAFDDLSGALALGDPDAPYFAARSLDNYRQLHRTVRTDPVLQRLLERAPLVAIWDDHEFADDCWQDNATHFDGRFGESDRERRRNAEQAYLEYIPIDIDDRMPGEAQVPRERLFPQLRIWRNLRFGRHLDLLLTDTRSERPDHLIPEDAFPGRVLHDAEELHARLPQLGIDPATLDGLLVPWIDLDAPAHAALRAPLHAVVESACLRDGLDETQARQYADTAVHGRIAWPVVGELLAQWNAQAPEAARVTVPDAAQADGFGLAWLSLGKSRLFSSLGARYMVPEASYAALAALLRGPVHRPMSDAQWQWLGDRLRQSDAGWKLVASSISLTPILLDLSRPELEAPAALRHRFLLNVDQWDGFPQARAALVDEVFAPAGNVVVLSGDIHAAFVSQHGPRVSEFTVPAVSSTTLGDIVADEVERDPASAATGRRLVEGLDALVAAGSSRLRHVCTRRHGVCLARVDGGVFEVELLTLPPALARQSFYERPEALAGQFERRTFRVAAESGQVAATGHRF
ncbi:alkaline phosphatase D family protein [Luteimonas saliphila]|uniref:alkaline phosphatase D family protein n=1 Tax=Luteimonas saliphila TaxID=2804919 RepID=UPI00192DA379